MFNMRKTGVRLLYRMGSQSGQQTQILKSRKKQLQFIDVFEHFLNPRLIARESAVRFWREEKLSVSQIASRLGVSRDLVVTSLRKARVYRAKRKANRSASAQVPFGWRREKNRLVPHKAEREVLQKIVKAHQEGASLNKIAESLNLLGAKTKNNGQWHAKTVGRILRRANRPFLEET